MTPGPGNTIWLTTANGLGAFAEPGADRVSYRSFTVARVEVEPSWLNGCEAVDGCEGFQASGRSNMADAALIIVEEEITDVPAAAIDLSPVEAGDSVVLTGYGCEDAVGGNWDYANQRLRIAKTKVLPFERIIHEGSFIYSEDRETVAAMVDGLYVITAGPEDAPKAGRGRDGGRRRSTNNRAGLCPGDSGGPLYRGRGGELTIVGINANYTFATGDEVELDETHSFKYGGSSVTNWHTRVDTKNGQKVGVWLRDLGVNTVCTRGRC